LQNKNKKGENKRKIFLLLHHLIFSNRKVKKKVFMKTNLFKGLFEYRNVSSKRFAVTFEFLFDNIRRLSKRIVGTNKDDENENFFSYGGIALVFYGFYHVLHPRYREQFLFQFFQTNLPAFSIPSQKLNWETFREIGLRELSICKKYSKNSTVHAPGSNIEYESLFENLPFKKVELNGNFLKIQFQPPWHKIKKQEFVGFFPILEKEQLKQIEEKNKKTHLWKYSSQETKGFLCYPPQEGKEREFENSRSSFEQGNQNVHSVHTSECLETSPSVFLIVSPLGDKFSIPDTKVSEFLDTKVSKFPKEIPTETQKPYFFRDFGKKREEWSSIAARKLVQWPEFPMNKKKTNKFFIFNSQKISFFLKNKALSSFQFVNNYSYPVLEIEKTSKTISLEKKDACWKQNMFWFLDEIPCKIDSFPELVGENLDLPSLSKEYLSIPCIEVNFLPQKISFTETLSDPEGRAAKVSKHSCVPLLSPKGEEAAISDVNPSAGHSNLENSSILSNSICCPPQRGKEREFPKRTHSFSEYSFKGIDLENSKNLKNSSFFSNSDTLVPGIEKSNTLVYEIENLSPEGERIESEISLPKEIQTIFSKSPKNNEYQLFDLKKNLIKLKNFQNSSNFICFDKVASPVWPVPKDWNKNSLVALKNIEAENDFLTTFKQKVFSHFSHREKKTFDLNFNFASEDLIHSKEKGVLKPRFFILVPTSSPKEKNFLQKPNNIFFPNETKPFKSFQIRENPWIGIQGIKNSPIFPIPKTIVFESAIQNSNGIPAGIPVGNLDTLVSRNLDTSVSKIENSETGAVFSHPVPSGSDRVSGNSNRNVESEVSRIRSNGIEKVNREEFTGQIENFFNSNKKIINHFFLQSKPQSFDSSTVEKRSVATKHSGVPNSEENSKNLKNSSIFSNSICAERESLIPKTTVLQSSIGDSELSQYPTSIPETTVSESSIPLPWPEMKYKNLKGLKQKISVEAFKKEFGIDLVNSKNLKNSSIFSKSDTLVPGIEKFRSSQQPSSKEEQGEQVDFLQKNGTCEGRETIVSGIVFTSSRQMSGYLWPDMKKTDIVSSYTSLVLKFLYNFKSPSFFDLNEKLLLQDISILLPSSFSIPSFAKINSEKKPIVHLSYKKSEFPGFRYIKALLENSNFPSNAENRATLAKNIDLEEKKKLNTRSDWWWIKWFKKGIFFILKQNLKEKLLYVGPVVARQEESATLLFKKKNLIFFEQWIQKFQKLLGSEQDSFFGEPKILVGEIPVERENLEFPSEYLKILEGELLPFGAFDKKDFLSKYEPLSKSTEIAFDEITVPFSLPLFSMKQKGKIPELTLYEWYNLLRFQMESGLENQENEKNLEHIEFHLPNIIVAETKTSDIFSPLTFLNYQNRGTPLFNKANPIAGQGTTVKGIENSETLAALPSGSDRAARVRVSGISVKNSDTSVSPLLTPLEGTAKGIANLAPRPSLKEGRDTLYSKKKASVHPLPGRDGYGNLRFKVVENIVSSLMFYTKNNLVIYATNLESGWSQNLLFQKPWAGKWYQTKTEKNGLKFFPAYTTNIFPWASEPVNGLSQNICFANGSYKKITTHFGKKRFWLNPIDQLLKFSSETLQLQQPFQENWESLTISSWMIVYKLVYILWIQESLKILYRRYGKEILGNLVSIFAALGFDMSEIIEFLELNHTDSGLRVIEKSRKDFADMAGMDHMLPELSEFVWSLRTKGTLPMFQNSPPSLQFSDLSSSLLIVRPFLFYVGKKSESSHETQDLKFKKWPSKPLSPFSNMKGNAVSDTSVSGISSGIPAGIPAGIPVGNLDTLVSRNLDTLVSRNLSPEGDRIKNSYEEKELSRPFLEKRRAKADTNTFPSSRKKIKKFNKNSNHKPNHFKNLNEFKKTKGFPFLHTKVCRKRPFFLDAPTLFIPPKGTLLVGPPGTGKTFLVQAIAGEANVPVVIQSASALMELDQKQSPSQLLRKLFDKARELSPCILFIDEVDTLGSSRENVLLDSSLTEIGNDPSMESFLSIEDGKSFSKAINQENSLIVNTSISINKGESFNSNEIGDIEESTGLSKQLLREAGGEMPAGEILQSHERKSKISKQQLAILMQFLVEMDGLKKLSGVVLIGATNRPSVLDPAFVRPGRFEKTIRLEIPNKQKRIEILKHYSKSLGFEYGINWDYLGNRTAGFTAADLSSAMNQSSINAILQKLDSHFHTVDTIEKGIEAISRERGNRSLSSLESKMFQKAALFETDNFLGNLTEKERIENLQNLVSPKDLELSFINGISVGNSDTLVSGIEKFPYLDPNAGEGKSVRPSLREEGVRRDRSIQLPEYTQPYASDDATPYGREERELVFSPGKEEQKEQRWPAPFAFRKGKQSVFLQENGTHECHENLVEEREKKSFKGRDMKYSQWTSFLTTNLQISTLGGRPLLSLKNGLCTSDAEASELLFDSKKSIIKDPFFLTRFAFYQAGKATLQPFFPLTSKISVFSLSNNSSQKLDFISKRDYINQRSEWESQIINCYAGKASELLALGTVVPLRKEKRKEKIAKEKLNFEIFKKTRNQFRNRVIVPNQSLDTKVSNFLTGNPIDVPPLPLYKGRDVNTQGVAYEPLKGVSSGDTKVSKFPKQRLKTKVFKSAIPIPSASVVLTSKKDVQTSEDSKVSKFAIANTNVSVFPKEIHNCNNSSFFKNSLSLLSNLSPSFKQVQMISPFQELWASSIGLEDLKNGTLIAHFIVEEWYLYSRKIASSNVLPSNKNKKEISDPYVLDSLKHISYKHKEEISKQNISQEKNQEFFISTWWQLEVTKNYDVADLSFGEWYRIFLSDPEEGERNEEWVAPDEHYSTIETLQNISNFFLLRNSKIEKLSEKSFNIFNVPEKTPFEIFNYTRKFNKLSFGSAKDENSKSLVTSNDSKKLIRDYIFYGLVSNGFNVAYDLLHKNREILDLFADCLVRFEKIREPEIANFSFKFFSENSLKKIKTSGFFQNKNKKIKNLKPLAPFPSLGVRRPPLFTQSEAVPFTGEEGVLPLHKGRDMNIQPPRGGKDKGFELRFSKNFGF
jgi:SpoVK/Ycf46/Vps4 family AAA+-type ATPase